MNSDESEDCIYVTRTCHREERYKVSLFLGGVSVASERIHHGKWHNDHDAGICTWDKTETLELIAALQAMCDKLPDTKEKAAPDPDTDIDEDAWAKLAYARYEEALKDPSKIMSGEDVKKAYEARKAARK